MKERPILLCLHSLLLCGSGTLTLNVFRPFRRGSLDQNIWWAAWWSELLLSGYLCWHQGFSTLLLPLIIAVQRERDTVWHFCYIFSQMDVFIHIYAIIDVLWPEIGHIHEWRILDLLLVSVYYIHCILSKIFEDIQNTWIFFLDFLRTNGDPEVWPAPNTM